MDKSNAIDKNMFNLEQMFRTWKLTRDNLTLSDLPEVAFFLADAMFSSRTIRVLTDPKKRKELATSLYAYVNKRAGVKLFYTVGCGSHAREDIIYILLYFGGLRIRTHIARSCLRLRRIFRFRRASIAKVLRVKERSEKRTAF